MLFELDTRIVEFMNGGNKMAEEGGSKNQAGTKDRLVCLFAYRPPPLRSLFKRETALSEMN